MTVVRGPLGSIRERQSVRYQMYEGEVWEEKITDIRKYFWKVISMGTMKASKASHNSSAM